MEPRPERKLHEFIGQRQLTAIELLKRSEESEFFKKWEQDFKTSLKTMPQTYEQDGMGENSIVHLHYFMGGMDWFITEIDKEPGPQLQAFGWADLGYGAEAGHICLPELFEAGVELDMYWTPKKIKECIKP